MEKSCGLYESQPVSLKCGDVKITPLNWQELNIALKQVEVLKSQDHEKSAAAQDRLAELMALHVDKNEPGEFVGSLSLADWKTLFESLLDISSIKKDEEKN